MQPGETIHPESNPNSTEQTPKNNNVYDGNDNNIDSQVQHSPTNNEINPEVHSDDHGSKQAVPELTWQYGANDERSNYAMEESSVNAVDWTASEFIDHEKRASWFVGLGVITIVGAVIVYLITRDIIAPVMILVAACLFGVTAGRKPSSLHYHIDNFGIKIGNKMYDYGQFKSFSIIEEGAIDSIYLSPLGRLSPPISLYYPPDQEEQILGTLGNYLPHEQKRHDPVERLMRRIRF